MYYIGIDISKFKHDCTVIDDAGDVVTPSWSFANDHDGFLQFKALLDSLGPETRIGLESTGHYGANLKLFLESSGSTFMEFNPPLINRFVKSKTLRKTKTDAIDCEMIARYLMTVEYKPYPPSFYHTEKLKSLTSFRDSLIRQRSRQLAELTDILNKVFPEFKPFFKGKFSAAALHILAAYSTPERIANMNARSYETLKKLSRGSFTVTDFTSLKHLARNTIGHPDDFLLNEMTMVIDIFSQLDSKVDEAETLISECVSELNPPMLTIPGIGVDSAAVILAEFGDFAKYESPAQLLSFAGMEPGYFQSGTSESAGRMVKHGSSYLRYALMNCARSVVNYEPTFAEYYAKKRAEGKSYRVALSHTAKKLIRVLFTLQTKNLVYDPDSMR